METIKQREKRRDKNIHSLTELEVAGNTIIDISEKNGRLLMKRGNTYTSYEMITLNHINYWTPITAYER